MNENRIKAGIEKTIQILGTPVTEYYPLHANIERQIIMENAVSILFVLLREIKGESDGRE